MNAKRLLPLVLIAALGFIAVKLTVDALRRAEAAAVKSRPIAADRALRQAKEAPQADEVPGLSGLRFAGSPGGDFDGNGYVDLADYAVLAICFTVSGPEADLSVPACLIPFDFDEDEDVDLADFAAFTGSLGHLPIPLRDTLGNVLLLDSTVPYSGRQTCAGTCHAHDIELITNGFKFQQGRTDVDGNVIIKDDYFDDGRGWQRSAGRYGVCSIGGSMKALAAKQSANESEIELTTFGWVVECGGCHPGGGPGEFDRDGLRLFDSATGQFGYERLGKTADQVLLDGDYSYMDASGQFGPARWDITGVAEADCLFCHTPDPAWNDGSDVNRRNWRMAALAAQADLVDNAGNPVPAFAAVGVASQGWFSSMPIVGGKATKLQIDYSVGVDAHTLLVEDGQRLALAPQSVDFPPRDNACWVCHGPVGWALLRGSIWFDTRDFHYAKLNNLLDTSPSNDVPPAESTACNYCHPGTLDHNFAKGNSFVQHFRDELDWTDLRSCRSCHLEDSPTRHPDAPLVPGTATAHLLGRMMEVLSCQACHIPAPRVAPAETRAFRDPSVTGNSINYMADELYSADPLDPSNPDKSAWYPALYPKVDQDGVVRFFPGLPPYLNIYWGDWDQRGTPEDPSDDIIAPIAIWRFKQITGGQPLSGVVDDTGDGKLEINRPEEILTYIQALKGNDSYGRQVAANPVLVRGPRVWHEDPHAPEGVSSFDADALGIHTDWQGAIWGMNHNVFRAAEGWGYDDPIDPSDGCRDCHRPDTLDSPVFDRLILVDPWDVDGLPVYRKVRDMTGLNPP